MKFAIGYQQPENGERFAAIADDYRDQVEEVYFPWVHSPSCREPLGGSHAGRDWTAQAELEEDLVALRKLNMKLDLLFNANCYGGDAMSERLAEDITSVISHLGTVCDLPDVVTTTSLTIAHVVKTRFPGIETRASVNMRIGTVQAMQYVSGLFDGFYLQRDLQRDPDYVREVHQWCLAHGKKLCLLVNSGCLRFCPGQIFHDNAVAHDTEIRERRNLSGWNPHVCWNLYRHGPESLAEFLRSTWIRPEDLPRYEGLADLFKLATRQHSHPRMVIDAYTSGRYSGNLLNLTEPCFAPLVAPRYIDNEAFPEDWMDRLAECRTEAERRTYCDTVLRRTLKSYS